MKGLNLSQFEKVKEDKDNVHMKHKDGHMIIIAVKALPKVQREQIKRLKMAEGGNVPHYADQEAPISADDAAPQAEAPPTALAPVNTQPAPALPMAEQQQPLNTGTQQFKG